MPFFSIPNTKINLYVDRLFNEVLFISGKIIASYSLVYSDLTITCEHITIIIEKKVTEHQCLINIYINKKLMFSSCYSK